MRGIVIGASALVVCGVGIAGVLYVGHSLPPVARLGAKTRPDQVVRPKITTVVAAAETSVPTEIAHDVAATGRPDGVAEWHLVDSNGNPLLCDISPTRRYYVTSNEIGRAEHNEPSDSEWNSVGCENAAPVHQAEIIAKQKAWNYCSALIQGRYFVAHHSVDVEAMKTAEFASCGAWPNTGSAPWPPDLSKDESGGSTAADSDAKDAVAPDANSGAAASTPNSEAAADGSASPAPH